MIKDQNKKFEGFCGEQKNSMNINFYRNELKKMIKNHNFDNEL